MPRLENWSVCALPPDPYTAPELWTSVLNGNVYGNKRFNDRTRVNTSSVKEINTITMKAQTRNTLYELGEPDPDFVKYLNEKGYSIHDYFHIITDDIKIKEANYFEIDCWDFEKLVHKVYGHKDYEYVADVECGNDSSQRYNGIKVDQESSKWDKRDLDEFIESGKYSNIAYILLQDMCRKKIIKPGNYLISVCW